MISTVVLACSLLAASCVLLGWHVRAWRAADHGGLAERDYEFHRRQFRRRIQASGMLGIVGLMMLGGLWIDDPIVAVFYWCGIAALVFWTALLALSDWLAVRLHYARLAAAHAAEHAMLRAEIDRYRREQRAGRKNDSSTPEASSDE